MKRPSSLQIGGLIGFFLSLPWVGLAWFGHKAFGLPMVPFTLFELLTRILPGAVVTAGLEAMIGVLQSLGVASTSTTGKLVEGAMAVSLVVVGLTALGAAHGWAQEGTEDAFSAWTLGLALSATTGVLLWWAGWGSPGAVAGLLWSLLLGVGWALGVDRIYEGAAQVGREETARTRREFLARVGAGSLTLSLIGLGLGSLFGREQTSVPPRAGFRGVPTPTPPPDEPGFEPVPGTRPELSRMPDFYRVDINLRPPQADAVSGAMRDEARLLVEEADVEPVDAPFPLAVRGLVERPRLLSLDEIRALPAVDQFATLECISNTVGGDLIDTTVFTGARLADVLELAGVRSEAQDIKFTCADGYTESLPIESATDPRTLLCYAMGGQPLSEEHGFPLRLYTPNRFGMKNPKWIVLLEMVGGDYRGYWEQRGWDEQAFVKLTSVIDAVEPVERGVVDVGGIAFAGARGVAGVEVRVNGGEWMPAELNRPISPLTWVQWRVRLEAEPGRRFLEVRAVDLDGNVQTATPSDTFPDGATGYHGRTGTFPG